MDEFDDGFWKNVDFENDPALKQYLGSHKNNNQESSNGVNNGQASNENRNVIPQIDVNSLNRDNGNTGNTGNNGNNNGRKKKRTFEQCFDSFDDTFFDQIDSSYMNNDNNRNERNNSNNSNNNNNNNNGNGNSNHQNVIPTIDVNLLQFSSNMIDGNNRNETDDFYPMLPNPKRARISNNDKCDNIPIVNVFNNNNFNNNNNNYNETYETDAPLCSGHKLPCKKMQVKKLSANHGRWFWACNQPRDQCCKTFIWDDLRIQEKNKSKNNNNANHNNNKNGNPYPLGIQEFTVTTELLCMNVNPLMAVIISPPKPQFVACIKECRDAVWNNKERKWILPVTQHNKLLHKLSKLCKQNNIQLHQTTIPQPLLDTIGNWVKHEKNKMENENSNNNNNNNSNNDNDNSNNKSHLSQEMSFIKIESNEKENSNKEKSKSRSNDENENDKKNNWDDNIFDENDRNLRQNVAFLQLPPKLQKAMYSFQIEGFLYAIERNGRALIADEMGLGKSIQAIAIAMYYHKDWPLLIVTPSSLRLTWKSEILKWLKGYVNVNNINVISSTKDKIVDYSGQSCKCEADITIISYGLAARKQAELNDADFNMIICDESHNLKNFKTQRCKTLLPLIKKYERAILLSGTPSNNRPSELHTQIDSLRPNEFLNFRLFSIRYCDGKPSKWGWDASGAIHLTELHALMQYRVMIRRQKKDVLTQLPDKIRTVIEIDIENKYANSMQKSLKKYEKQLSKQSNEKSNNLPCYLQDDDNNNNDEMQDDDVMNLTPNGKNENNKKNNNNDKDTVVNINDGMMLQLYSLTGKAKIGGICEYIGDLYDSLCVNNENENEKFLIFGHHKEVLDGIESYVIDKLKCDYMRIDGSVKEEERDKSVKRFQTNGQCKIAILSITAAGTGLTLTAASTVVFAELYWSPSELLQCEDRAHRISQKNVVNVIYLLGKPSLDDKLWPMIKRKIEVVGKCLTGKNTSMEINDYQAILKMSGKKNHSFNDNSHYNNDNNNNNGFFSGRSSSSKKKLQYSKHSGTPSNSTQRSIIEMFTPKKK